jgi:hypothetical protein
MYSSNSLESYSSAAYRAASRRNSRYPRLEKTTTHRTKSAESNTFRSFLAECEYLVVSLTNPNLATPDRNRLFNRCQRLLSNLNTDHRYLSLSTKEQTTAAKHLIEALYYSSVIPNRELLAALLQLRGIGAIATALVFETFCEEVLKFDARLINPNQIAQMISLKAPTPATTTFSSVIFSHIVDSLSSPEATRWLSSRAKTKTA